MPYLADRVRDTTTSTGTGAITLAGSAPTGFRTFAAAFGAGSQTVSYCIDDNAGNWEVGTGTFNGTTGLTRAVVKASSNANALVNFGVGTKSVFCTANADILSGSLAASAFTMSTAKLIGRSTAATGAPEEITVGAGLSLSAGTITSGAIGGGTDKVFWENGQTVNTNYTITASQNAMSAGPITIANGVTVTVPNGCTWTVV